MVEPILISPIFKDFILPFTLVFTLVFAVLEKTKLLGDGKKQIDAIIGLIVGLILISFSFARDVVVGLMPYLAIGVVILLIFMLLYGFASGKKEGDVLERPLKILFGIIIGIGLVVAILFATQWINPLYSYLFQSGTGTQVLVNGILIVVIAAAIIAVVWTKEGSGKST